MAVLSLSVSELKCACLDAGWRRRWLQGERPSTRHFAPPGTAAVGGAAFHALAEAFLAWLAGSPQESRALVSEEQLWAQLYHRFAERELDRLLSAAKVPTALYLSSALQAFCGRLSQLRRQSERLTGWTDLILTQEERVHDVRVPVGGSSVLLSGTVDALRLHPGHGLEIVDYKLSRAANLRHDLLQIAIYARLIRLSRAGLDFRGCLEYYLPTLEALEISAGELAEIFDDLVEPVLFELAGERSPAAVVKPETKPAAAKPDATAEKILACFQAFKLPVEMAGRQEAPQIVRYLVRPAAGVRVVSLANRAEDLQVNLGLAQTPRIEPSAGGVAIDVPKPVPDLVLWRDVAGRCGDGPLAFPLGVGIDNALLVARLDDPGTCHGLVAGASGSGKSEWLKAAVATLMSRNRPATLPPDIDRPEAPDLRGVGRRSPSVRAGSHGSRRRSAVPGRGGSGDGAALPLAGAGAVQRPGRASPGRENGLGLPGHRLRRICRPDFGREGGKEAIRVQRGTPGGQGTRQWHPSSAGDATSGQRHRDGTHQSEPALESVSAGDQRDELAHHPG